MKIKALVAGVALGVFAGQAMAASDGSFGVGLGATSTGTSVINAFVGDLIRIAGLADITLADVAGDLTGSDAVCVFRNGVPGQNYELTITSANGSFTLIDTLGGTDTLAYSVAWTETVGVPSTSAVVYNTAQTITGASSNQATCANGTTNNASFAVTVTAAELVGKASGFYSDTLNITVGAL